MTESNFFPNAFLHHLSIETPDPKALAQFYSDTLGMKTKEYIYNNITTWMCFGNDRRLIFVKGEKKKLNFAGFSCRDKSGLSIIRKKAKDEKIEINDHDTPFFKDGSFSLKDPDHNMIVFGLSKTKNGI